MEQIIRKGIAFSPRELEEFDSVMKQRGYANRSEAIRDMVRRAITEERQEQPDAETMATLTIVYDHHEHHVQDALTDIQHRHPNIIRSSLHVHVDHHTCLEVIVLQGKVAGIRSLSDAIIAAKGVKHGRLVMMQVG